MTADADKAQLDGSNTVDTSSVLYNEVSKDSRRKDFLQLNDPNIFKIFEITIVSKCQASPEFQNQNFLSILFKKISYNN